MENRNLIRNDLRTNYGKSHNEDFVGSYCVFFYCSYDDLETFRMQLAYVTASSSVTANYVMGRLMVFLSPESNKQMRDAAFEFNVQQGYLTPDYPRYENSLQ